MAESDPAKSQQKSFVKVLVHQKNEKLTLVQARNSELWKSISDAKAWTFIKRDFSSINNLVRNQSDEVLLQNALLYLIAMSNTVKENIALLARDFRLVTISDIEYISVLEEQIILLKKQSEILANYFWSLKNLSASQSKRAQLVLVQDKFHWISETLNVEGSDFIWKLIVLAIVTTLFFSEALGCFSINDSLESCWTPDFESISSNLITCLKIDAFVFSRYLDKPDEVLVHKVLMEALSKECWFIRRFCNISIHRQCFEYLDETANKFLTCFGYNPLPKKNDGHRRDGDGRGNDGDGGGGRGIEPESSVAQQGGGNNSGSLGPSGPNQEDKRLKRNLEESSSADHDPKRKRHQQQEKDDDEKKGEDAEDDEEKGEQQRIRMMTTMMKKNLEEMKSRTMQKEDDE